MTSNNYSESVECQYEQLKVKLALGGTIVEYNALEWEFAKELYKNYKSGRDILFLDYSDLKEKYDSCYFKNVQAALADMGVTSEFIKISENKRYSIIGDELSDMRILIRY